MSSAVVRITSAGGLAARTSAERSLSEGIDSTRSIRSNIDTAMSGSARAGASDAKQREGHTTGAKEGIIQPRK